MRVRTTKSSVCWTASAWKRSRLRTFQSRTVAPGPRSAARGRDGLVGHGRALELHLPQAQARIRGGEALEIREGEDDPAVVHLGEARLDHRRDRERRARRRGDARRQGRGRGFEDDAPPRGDAQPFRESGTEEYRRLALRPQRGERRLDARHAAEEPCGREAGRQVERLHERVGAVRHGGREDEGGREAGPRDRRHVREVRERQANGLGRHAGVGHRDDLRARPRETLGEIVAVAGHEPHRDDERRGAERDAEEREERDRLREPPPRTRQEAPREEGGDVHSPDLTV